MSLPGCADVPGMMEGGIKVKQEVKEEPWPLAHTMKFKEEEEFLVDNFNVADSLVFKEEEEWTNFSDYFYCYHCGSCFNKLRILRLHIRDNHLRGTKINEDLSSHLMSLLKSPDSLYEYVNPPHKKKFKQKKKKSYQCLLCDYRTCYPGNLHRHHNSYHVVKSCLCQLCDYKTSRSDSLKTHTMRHHTDLRPHHCKLCDFKTVELRCLKKHMRNKHGNKKALKHVSTKPKEKNFHCIFCDYKANLMSDINRHMNRKHGEKKNQCSFCKYKTNYPFVLKQHIDACHTDLRPYKCSLCGYKTAISSHLRRHMRGKKHRALFNQTK